MFPPVNAMIRILKMVNVHCLSRPCCGRSDRLGPLPGLFGKTFHCRCGSVLFGTVLALVFVVAGTANAKSRSALTHGEGHVPDTLVVAFYNVENLFDLVADGSEYPEYRPYHAGWDTYACGVKVNNIASVIATMSADIIGLCELENERTLEMLVAELERQGCPYPYHAVADKPHKTNTVTAILSRYALGAVSGIETVRTGNYWSRNILEAQVLIGNDTLLVYVNHWPSKHQKESFRVASARVLVNRLGGLRQNQDYIVLGDLNENWNECETFGTEGFDNSSGITGLNHVAGTCLSGSSDCPDYRRGPSAGGLYDTWLDKNESQRGSEMFNGQWNTPDHILIPQSLSDSAGWSYVPGSFEVFTMHDQLLRFGRPWRWEIRRTSGGKEHVGNGYSDHLPLRCQLVRAVQNPVVFTAYNPVKSENRPCDKVIDFEYGVDGWVGNANGVRVARQADSTGRGTVLNMLGAARNNATIARVLIPVSRFSTSAPRHLALDMRGHGNLCLRLRPEDNGSWRYWSFAAGTLSGRADYSPVSMARWERICIDLPWRAVGKSGLEIEMRSKGSVPINMSLDTVLAY